MSWLSETDLLICRFAHLSYDEIAEKTSLSPRTVKWHVDKIRLKIGVEHKRHIQDRLHELGVEFEKEDA